MNRPGNPQPLPPREFFEREARLHLVEGDLFSYPNPVIPVMTRGRAYGSISRALVEVGVQIPELSLCEARFVERFIFVALWDDHSTYDDRTIQSCAAACLKVASDRKMKTLVMPVLGGKGGERYLWLMERGIFEMTDRLDEAGRHVPDEHVYVTDKVVDPG